MNRALLSHSQLVAVLVELYLLLDQLPRMC
jgi:hypothetical protein